MIFYRHPTPDVAPGLCYGRWNIGLGAKADEEISAACEAPPDFDYIVCSPSWRARQLAEALARKTGKPLEFDERLYELNFGRWEGEFWADIDRKESQPWSENPGNWPRRGARVFRCCIPVSARRCWKRLRVAVLLPMPGRSARLI